MAECEVSAVKKPKAQESAAMKERTGGACGCRDQEADEGACGWLR